MKCVFCGREVPEGTQECPYCHYQFTLVPQVLSPNERDSFEGVTIEEDGWDDGAQEDPSEPEVEEAEPVEEEGPRIQVHTYGCGSSLLVTLLVVAAVLAFFFFVMPMFFVFALVGALVLALLRFLGGFF